MVLGRVLINIDARGFIDTIRTCVKGVRDWWMLRRSIFTDNDVSVVLLAKINRSKCPSHNGGIPWSEFTEIRR